MTTPEPRTPRDLSPSCANGWREIIQSNADHTCTEGFALEQLIDLQRAQSPRGGEAR